MAKLICALLVVVLLGIMFSSCDSISFGHESMGKEGRRGELRSKINRPDTFHPDGAHDTNEAADENYKAVNKNNDVADNYYKDN